MSAKIKYLGFFIVVIAIIVLVVVFTWNGGKDMKIDTKAFRSTQTEETGGQYKMYFCFEGDKSQIIDLIKGKVELNLVYRGTSKFTAKLFNSDGTLFSTLADVIGPYKQKQVIDVPETGAYQLDVRTSGEWSLSRQ